MSLVLIEIGLILIYISVTLLIILHLNQTKKIKIYDILICCIPLLREIYLMIVLNTMED